MSAILQTRATPLNRPALPRTQSSVARAVRVRPSIVDSPATQPFTLDQELKQFGTWVDNPVWVPPKNSSDKMARSMLDHAPWFASDERRWNDVIARHRDSFTQVREIEMTRASIRLPQQRLFVSVTEPKDFGSITDEVPRCVQTRLDEFMSGPGQRRGVKVSYLKPLCVEVDDQLHFTSGEDVFAATEKIKSEVFSIYRRWLPLYAVKDIGKSAIQAAIFAPRVCTQFMVDRRQRALDAYRSKLEFQRRRTALRAVMAHRQCRSHGCTFDDMLALTNPLETTDVIRQYSIEKQLTTSRQSELLHIAAGALPWFTAFSLGLSSVASVTMLFLTPLTVCDPAFVAGFPEQPGVLWNIGHFDEINGVRHVEI